MDTFGSRAQEFFGSIKGSISGHQTLSSGSSYQTSYNQPPSYTGTAAFGSYQGAPAGSGYNQPSYSYTSPPPASSSTRPAKSSSPATSKPAAPRNTEQDLDAWLDEKPKAKKAASRKKSEPKAVDLISLEEKKPVDPLADFLDSAAPVQDDAFAAFAAVPTSSPPPSSGDADPFEAFGNAVSPSSTASAPDVEEEDPFAAFLSSTAVRPSSAPPSAPAVVSATEELVAAPSPAAPATAVAQPVKAAVPKPKVARQAKPASAPVSRTAVDKLKDTHGNKRNDEILRELLRLPANQTCADCNAAYPDWASVNLGVFVCLKCSGHHRNMGTHISKVRSVNLDTWTADQLAVMESVGNANARLIYETALIINDIYLSELLAWIKDKYEYGRFKGKPSAPVATATVAPQVSPARKRRPKKAAAVAATDEGPDADEP